METSKRLQYLLKSSWGVEESYVLSQKTGSKNQIIRIIPHSDGILAQDSHNNLMVINRTGKTKTLNRPFEKVILLFECHGNPYILSKLRNDNEIQMTRILLDESDATRRRVLPRENLGTIKDFIHVDRKQG